MICQLLTTGVIDSRSSKFSKADGTYVEVEVGPHGHHLVLQLAGVRDVAARDFYEAAYMTDREDDELLTRITFTAPVGGYAYPQDVAGDYREEVIVLGSGAVLLGATVVAVYIIRRP